MQKDRHLEKKQPAPDFLIKVDRSKKPIYPDWVKRVLHPEFELYGPEEFNLQKDVSLCFHKDQKTGSVTGDEVYNQLKKDDFLKDCLNLADFQTIEKTEAKVFRSLYGGKRVFGWKSVCEGTDHDLSVPYLTWFDDHVYLSWISLKSDFIDNYYLLRFNKAA